MNLNDFIRRLAIPIVSVAIVPPALAQVWYLENLGNATRISAPIFHGSVQATPSMTAIPSMQAVLIGLQTTNGQPVAYTGYTDSTGRFGGPAGAPPFVVQRSAHGMVSRKVVVIRMPLPGTVQAASMLEDWTTPQPTISMYPTGAPFYSTSEFNGFYHMNKAVGELDRILGDVRFLSPHQEHLFIFTSQASIHSARILYVSNEDRFYVCAGSTNWENAIMARSGTVVAHECARRYIHGIRGSHVMPGAIDRGFADFLATQVTGSSIIGEGLDDTLLPRDIANAPGARAADARDPQVQGWRLAGALYRTKLYWLPVQGVPFLKLIRPLLDQKPTSGEDVLRKLLILDDDNSTLADGTPNDIALYNAFTDRAGYDWPSGVPIP